jgi:hypothetical protein
MEMELMVKQFINHLFDNVIKLIFIVFFFIGNNRNELFKNIY